MYRMAPLEVRYQRQKIPMFHWLAYFRQGVVYMIDLRSGIAVKELALEQFAADVGLSEEDAHMWADFLSPVTNNQPLPKTLEDVLWGCEHMGANKKVLPKAAAQTPSSQQLKDLRRALENRRHR